MLTDEKKYWSRIGRGSQYPECGFMVWDLHHKVHQEYWKHMENMYDDGELFNSDKWHDSFVWWEVEKKLEAKYFCSISHDLGDGGQGHAFVRGILGKYFDHLKGNRKLFGFSPEGKTFIV